jgi:hypothetical protein
MNFLVWRLHRNQAYFGVGALALLTLLLLITGVTMANDYHVALTECRATGTCSDLGGQLFRGDGAIMDLVNLTVIVPLLFGLFWGAPLLAKEFEDGTQNLVWTQGVTRRHWFRANVMWVLVASIVWGAAMAALVSWWRFPENALDSRFGAFDIQGIVPVAYALFAVTLGIAVGSVFKRVLPSLATTLGVFVGVRVAIAVYLRPHFMTPVSRLFPLLGSKGGAPPGSWVISSTIVGPDGRVFGDPFSFNDMPAACSTSFPGGKGVSGACLQAHGFHQLVSFQPASRFWAFQGIEASIFIVLALALVGFAYRRVLTRDA